MVESDDNKYYCCQVEQCNIFASYAFEAAPENKYCTRHRQLGMKDIVKAKCIIDKCRRRPKFSYGEGQRPTRCSFHRQFGMINVCSKNKKCNSPGCQREASFGWRFCGRREYCKLHMEFGQVNLKAKKCYFDGCNKCVVAYNNYCAEHTKIKTYNLFV